MEESYKLEKEYKVPVDTFSDAYLAFQKKFIYPKSRVYMIIFTVIAIALLIVGVLRSGDTTKTQRYLIYIAFMFACAFAVREWYSPKKIHRSITESVRTLGEPLYKIGIGEKYVDISTVADDLSNIPEEEKQISEDNDPLPEKTRLTVDESFQLMEHDKFFLLMSGKEMFYILPKEGFSESELKIVRDIKK